MRHLERVQVAWDTVVHPQLQTLTHEPLSSKERHEIEGNVLLRATTPAVGAAAALIMRSETISEMFTRGMRIRPLGRMIEQWYPFAIAPILMAGSTMHSTDAAGHFKRYGRSLARLSSLEAEYDRTETSDNFGPYLDNLINNLHQNPTGASLVQHSLDELLPGALEDSPKTRHIIEPIVRLGAERYRNYYSYAFCLLYSGGRS